MVTGAGFRDDGSGPAQRKPRDFARPDPLAPVHKCYRFGDYVLDEEHWTLLRADEDVPIAPQPFRLLACLIRHRGRLVTKEELVEAAWPGLAISDSALASALHVARRAIGDDGHEQAAIITCRKRGYRFTLPVEEIGETPDEA